MALLGCACRPRSSWPNCRFRPRPHITPQMIPSICLRVYCNKIAIAVGKSVTQCAFFRVSTDSYYVPQFTYSKMKTIIWGTWGTWVQDLLPNTEDSSTTNLTMNTVLQCAIDFLTARAGPPPSPCAPAATGVFGACTVCVLLQIRSFA